MQNVHRGQSQKCHKKASALLPIGHITLYCVNMIVPVPTCDSMQYHIPYVPSLWDAAPFIEAVIY